MIRTSNLPVLLAALAEAERVMSSATRSGLGCGAELATVRAAIVTAVADIKDAEHAAANRATARKAKVAAALAAKLATFDTLDNDTRNTVVHGLYRSTGRAEHDHENGTIVDHGRLPDGRDCHVHYSADTPEGSGASNTSRRSRLTTEAKRASRIFVGNA